MMFTVGMSFPRSCPARRKITLSGWFLFKLLFRAAWACGGMEVKFAKEITSRD